MQPYFLPYIGYFQLMNSVDKFIIYDNIEYSKKGWVNKNRFILNGKEKLFSIPLKKDSDFLNIDERYRSENSKKEAIKITKQIYSSYRKAPYFTSIFPLLFSRAICKLVSCHARAHTGNMQYTHSLDRQSI